MMTAAQIAARIVKEAREGGIRAAALRLMACDANELASRASGLSEPEACAHGIPFTDTSSCRKCEADIATQLRKECENRASQPPHGMVQKLDLVVDMLGRLLLMLERMKAIDDAYANVGIMQANQPRKSKEIPPRPAIFPEALEELRDEEMRREFEASKARAIAHLREHHAAGNGPSPEPWIKQLARIDSAEELAKGFCELLRDCDALIDKLFKSPGEDPKEFERVMAERGGMESPTMDEVAATPLTGYATMHDKPGKSGAECVIREHGKPDRKGIVMPPNVTMALIAYGEGSITLRQLHQRIRAIEEDIDVWGEEDECDGMEVVQDGDAEWCGKVPTAVYAYRDGKLTLPQLIVRLHEINREFITEADQSPLAGVTCPHGVPLVADCNDCECGKPQESVDTAPKAKPQDKL